MNSQVHELKLMNSKFMNLTNFMNLAISCSWIVHELFMNKCSWTAHELFKNHSWTVHDHFTGDISVCLDRVKLGFLIDKEPCPHSSGSLTYPFLTYPFLTYPFLTYPFLTYPFLTYPFLTYPFLTYPFLTYPFSHQLSFSPTPFVTYHGQPLSSLKPFLTYPSSPPPSPCCSPTTSQQTASNECKCPPNAE